MDLMQQIFWGSVVLGLCGIIHVMIISFSIPLLKHVAARFDTRFSRLRLIILLWVSMVSIVLALTVQIWIWSFAWVLSGALDDWNTAIYFSLVTYTTLGYGDIVLGPGLRIFAAFAAVGGLLSFGISTAFLIGILTRFMPNFDKPE